VVFEIYERTDKQTDIQTDLSQYFAPVPKAKQLEIDHFTLYLRVTRRQSVAGTGELWTCSGGGAGDRSDTADGSITD